VPQTRFRISLRVVPSHMSETFYGPNGKVWVALFLVGLGFVLACLLPTINLPWVEEDNYYGALYSQAAHNNLRAGLCVTSGVPVPLYFGPLPIPRDAYYVHHPVLMPLMVTAAVAIFGERERSVKLVPILCSVASALFLWLLVRDAIGRRAAALATAFFVTLPMELHYGDMVDFEPPLLMWMLAALLCLRYWHVRRTNVWIVLAGFCCGGAVWTDWPGYLFILSISISLLLRKERRARFLGMGLFAIAAASGTLFLLQIRHVNPGSWHDLWTAVTMRLGSGVAAGSSQIDQATELHFTFGKWVRRILQGLGQDYLFWTWGFVLLGTIFLVRNLKSSGWRWLGWAVLQMAAAGISYMLLLRNWSYIHDWASFSLIGAISIQSGLGLEGLMEWIDRSAVKFFQPVGAIAIVILFVFQSAAGFMQAEAQRSQLTMLDGQVSEPAGLIPDAGRYLESAFPAETTILCNFDPYYSTLSYYAQRTILRNVGTADEWKDALDNGKRLGGILWMGAPSTPEILAILPKDEVQRVEIDGIRFALWRPGQPDQILVRRGPRY
jgi:4-amino-4-deoxy-L-arabinose transferase-like glycosyltransferase